MPPVGADGADGGPSACANGVDGCGPPSAGADDGSDADAPTADADGVNEGETTACTDDGEGGGDSPNAAAAAATKLRVRCGESSIMMFERGSRRSF